MLFEKIVFGPIKSRRLGTSLGVNLLPKGNKICTFNCIYCECGFNSINIKEAKYPTVEEVKFALESRLNEMQQNNEGLETITFAGDGEPTMNPFFLEIIEETIRLRDFYFPLAKISVLSNATMLNNERVFEALKMVDNNILKLDSVNEETVKEFTNPIIAHQTAKSKERAQNKHGKMQVVYIFCKKQDFFTIFLETLLKIV